MTGETKSHPAPIYWLGRIISLFSHILSAKAPEGYEDESGFHYGRREDE